LTAVAPSTIDRLITPSVAICNPLVQDPTNPGSIVPAASAPVNDIDISDAMLERADPAAAASASGGAYEW
jgi:hypothetical protein